MIFAVQSGHVFFFFLQPLVPNDSAFLYTIFVKHTCCSNIVNSKVGKQTKSRDIFIHKYIKTKVGFKHSISHKSTFSPNPHLVKEPICFPFFEPGWTELQNHIKEFDVIQVLFKPSSIFQRFDWYNNHSQREDVEWKIYITV